MAPAPASIPVLVLLSDSLSSLTVQTCRMCSLSQESCFSHVCTGGGTVVCSHLKSVCLSKTNTPVFLSLSTWRLYQDVDRLSSIFNQRLTVHSAVTVCKPTPPVPVGHGHLLQHGWARVGLPVPRNRSPPEVKTKLQFDFFNSHSLTLNVPLCRRAVKRTCRLCSPGRSSGSWCCIWSPPEVLWWCRSGSEPPRWLCPGILSGCPPSPGHREVIE